MQNPGSWPCARASAAYTSSSSGPPPCAMKSRPKRPARFGRGAASAAPHHRRPTGRDRRRSHVDAPALVVERLAGLGQQQERELVLDERAAAGEVGAVVLELLGPVADGHDVADPAAADDVEDDHVLGEPDRVVQRQDHAAVMIGRRGRAGGHRGRQHQGRRQVAVGHRVVLAHDCDDRAAALGEARHLQRGGVQLAGRRPELRCTHVEAHQEHWWPSPSGGACRLGRAWSASQIAPRRHRSDRRA